MRNLFEAQQAVAEQLTSSSEKVSYLCSVLRSLLQVAAVTALEVIREQTPASVDNAALGAFAKRFSQPTDGLPVEILEVSTPVIRSFVSRTYHTGWFEQDPAYGKPLAAEAAAWVAFRNKKPAHGVLSKADADEWAPKLSVLLTRCLACFGDSLPRVMDANTLRVTIASSEVTLKTPLLRAGLPVVISAVDTRKGIWKLEGQTLSWDKSDTFTVDLPAGSVFEELESNFPSKFTVIELEYEGAKHSVFSNVPVRQTSTFEGRAKELIALRDWMNEPEESRSCLIHGDGGFGKTTLTLEFLNRVLDGNEQLNVRPPSVISYYSAKMTRWTDEGIVHLRGISDAMEDCVRELLFCLTPVLSKDYYKLSGNALIDRVAGEFSQQGFKRDDILLVLDNTETLATTPNEVEDFSTFLKQIGRRLGRVLITSRRREYVASEPLQISALSDAESASLMRRLGDEYNATAIKQAGEATLRQTARQLSNKPLLIDTLVKYLARSPGIGIKHAIEQVFMKTNDQLLEFLYNDAWLRINELQQDVFLVLVSSVVPLDSLCVADSCALVGIQHIEFQKGLDETYFATLTDYGDHYELQIVELAGRFFQQQLRKRDDADRRRIEEFAREVEKRASRRQIVDRAYRQDRVAEAFRSQFAKAAKIAAAQGDLKSAEENFRLALQDEPMNAALHDRFAWFLLIRCQRPADAVKLAQRAVELDSHNADAFLTLGLCWYYLGELAKGDKEILVAGKKGKPQALCMLRMGIARYHLAKEAPQAKETPERLNQAIAYVDQAIKSMDPSDTYIEKNMREARKYEALLQRLQYRIKVKEIAANEAQPRRPS
jgi:Tfp pilus assembly protein PilF/GTPase SAR1 family protein